MNRHFLFLIKLFLLLIMSSKVATASPCETQKFRMGSLKLAFLSDVDAKRVIYTADDFISRLNNLNRALRLMVNRNVSYNEYFDFVQKTVQCWSQPEISEILKSARILESKMQEINSQGFQLSVYFVKNNGQDEGGAYYTRGNFVAVPKGRISTSTLAHEFFHIFTRTHNHLKDRIYFLAGFYPQNISVPPALSARLIINPDAPIMSHAIRVNYNNEVVEVVPLILSRVDVPQIDPQKPNFFSYVNLVLLSLSNSELIPVNKTNYFEVTGGNTNYIIHPEEIMADNFASLMTEENVPNKNLLLKLQSLLSRSRLNINR